MGGIARVIHGEMLDKASLELRKAREQAGLSVRQAGKICGCTGGYISNLENASHFASRCITEKKFDFLMTQYMNYILKQNGEKNGEEGSNAERCD